MTLESKEQAEEADVWDRTSGAEDEDQDARAQAATTATRAAEAGFAVRSVRWDKDVPGDVPWEERREMQKALREAEANGRVFVTRSPSRLWRGRPWEGFRYAEGVPNLEVLGKPHWSRRGGKWVDDSDGADLYRYIDAHQAWAGKRGIREETQHAMTAIKRGERATKSGNPVGRPRWRPFSDAAARAAADCLLTGGSQTQAVEAYRRAAGFYDVRDEAARAKRDVARRVLIPYLREGGLIPGENPDPAETVLASHDDSPGAIRPVLAKPGAEGSTEAGGP